MSTNSPSPERTPAYASVVLTPNPPWCPLCERARMRTDEPPLALRNHLEDYHRVVNFRERDRLITDAFRRADNAPSQVSTTSPASSRLTGEPDA